jgi:hypothetical protein
MFLGYIAERNSSVMKHLMTFENHVLDIETKAKKLEEEKEETSNLDREKEVQKLKNEKEKQDKELKKRTILFKKKKVRTLNKGKGDGTIKNNKKSKYPNHIFHEIPFVKGRPSLGVFNGKTSQKPGHTRPPHI